MWNTVQRSQKALIKGMIEAHGKKLNKVCKKIHSKERITTEHGIFLVKFSLTYTYGVCRKILLGKFESNACIIWQNKVPHTWRSSKKGCSGSTEFTLFSQKSRQTCCGINLAITLTHKVKTWYFLANLKAAQICWVTLRFLSVNLISFTVPFYA